MPSLIKLAQSLARQCDALRFGGPVTHVYNPLIYALKPHTEYLKHYARGPKRTLFLGINPGPWGMAQTGVPFGDVVAVRDWLKINAPVGKPQQLHPRRPVYGFACPRREISGQRLWGLMQKCFGSADAFFHNHLILNYCPLLFSRITDRRCTNITPDKLTFKERQTLYTTCDHFLYTAVTRHVKPEYLVGIGAFATARLQAIFPDRVIYRIPHPSPANPIANRDFDGAVQTTLHKLGIW